MVGLTSSFFLSFFTLKIGISYILKKKENAFRIKLKATFLCY